MEIRRFKQLKAGGLYSHVTFLTLDFRWPLPPVVYPTIGGGICLNRILSTNKGAWRREIGAGRLCEHTIICDEIRSSTWMTMQKLRSNASAHVKIGENKEWQCKHEGNGKPLWSRLFDKWWIYSISSTSFAREIFHLACILQELSLQLLPKPINNRRTTEKLGFWWRKLVNGPRSLLEYHKDACRCQIPCQNLIFHHTHENKQDTLHRKKGGLIFHMKSTSKWLQNYRYELLLLDGLGAAPLRWSKFAIILVKSSFSCRLPYLHGQFGRK